MERNVPKLRFKGFNDELKKEKFQNLVTLQRGSSPRPIIKYITTSEDGVNWIKIGDVSTGKTFIDKTAEKITKEGAKKSRKVQVGDLILSNSMSFGRPYIMKIDGYIHDGWFVLKNYQKNFNREYLCQLLTSPIIQKQYKRLAAGGVVNNISSELVNAVIVNVPSLQEQERIANFLTKVDKIIEKQDEKVKNLEKYKKGMMQKIFSQEIRFKDENGEEYPDWEKSTFNDILVEDLYPVPKPSEKYEKISVRSHAKGTFSSIVEKPEEVNMDTLYEVKGKQLIVNITFAWEHAIAIVKKEDENKLVSHRFPTYKFKENANYEFYGNYIKLPIIKYKLSLASPGGAGRNRVLNKKEFLKIEVPVPCIDEQMKIAKFLSDIDNITEKEQKKLDKLRVWKKGLLQQMFV